MGIDAINTLGYTRALVRLSSSKKQNRSIMNIITNIGIRTLGFALAAFLSVAFFLALAPQAQAADWDGGYDYIDTFSDFGGYDYGGGYDYIDTFSDFGGYDYGGGYDYIDTFTPDSFFGGSTLGGGSGGGYGSPFSTLGGGGGNMQSQSQSQGQSQSQSSNNTNVNNNVNSININVPQAQPTVAQPVCPVGMQGVYPNCVYPQPVPPPTYDICPNLPGIQATLPAGYFIQNGFCQYQNYTTPVYPTPAPQPYVTLSQVPYTGLELGTMGTIAYWGFLALWCLLAAYFIAVKKVQNKIVAWFTGSTPSHVAHVARAAHAPSAKAVASAKVSGIDPFIQAQINRAAN